VTDGTPGGTAIVRSMTVETGPVALGGKVVYGGRTSGTGAWGLWIADATGAVQVAGPQNPRFFSSLSSTDLVFVADCGTGAAGDPRRECLWRTNGTAGGTTFVKDIWAGGTALGSSVRFLGQGGPGTVFFAGDDGLTGQELWKTDGTEGGTVLVRDINPTSLGSTPNTFLRVGTIVFFRADDGSRGRELWKTDGTRDGTVLVKDIRPGGDGSSPLNFAALGDKVFFYADDGTRGAELWGSNGTDAGTALVKDVSPGPAASNPYGLTTVGGLIYFGAADPVSGVELWRTDGTTAGTWIVKDINPGTGSSGPLGFTTVHGYTYFQANDGVTGLELWRTDGTAAGTTLVADLMPGSSGSEPSDLEALGDTLLFAATYGVTGTELWKVTGWPRLGPITPALTVGAPNTITGTGFTAGSVVQIFVSTVTGAVSYGPWTPTAWTATSLTFEIPATVPLANGFAAVQVVNTDEGFLASNVIGTLLYGNAAVNIPTILTVRGTGLATPEPGIAVAHVDTVASRGETITITGTGFNAPLVNLFTGTANIGPLAPVGGVWTPASFQVTVPPGAPAGPGNFQVVNSPYAGNVQSNAVATVLVSQPAITSVSVSGSTVTVNGAGFCPLSVINLFNAQGGGVVNLGGLTAGGAARIPLTFVNETQFTFTVPAGTVAGAAYVQVLNPPFNPFSTSGSDPDGAFTTPAGAPLSTWVPAAAPDVLAAAVAATVGAAPAEETGPAVRAATWTATVDAGTAAGDVWRGDRGAPWRSGARTTTALVGDGRFEWTVGASRGEAVAGLSEGDRDASPGNIAFGLRVRSGSGDLAVVENGRRVAGVGPVAAGDRLAITVRGDAVEYFRNGVLLWTSTRAPRHPLVGDVSFGPGRAHLDAASLSGRLATAIEWAVGEGVTAEGMRARSASRAAVTATAPAARAVEAVLEGAAGIGFGGDACDYCIVRTASGMQVRHAGEVRGAWPASDGTRVRIELDPHGAVRYFAGSTRLDEAPVTVSPARVLGWFGESGAAIVDATAEAARK